MMNRGRGLSHLVHSETEKLWCKTLEMNKGDYRFATLNLVEGTSPVSNAKAMSIFYLIQGIMSFTICMGLFCFSRYLPTEIP